MALLLATGRALYLLFPLIVAAALSALVLRLDLLPVLRMPIDGGRLFRGQPLFGAGKTWRGLLTAVVGCVVGVLIQKHWLQGWPERLSLLDYTSVDPFLFGATMGTAAILGELPNSFTKRRLGIAAGKTSRGWLGVLFYVWDQIDLLTVVWPALLPWLRPDLLLLAGSVLVAMTVHPTISLLGHLLGARKTAR